jgi:hypothetical protein
MVASGLSGRLFRRGQLQAAPNGRTEEAVIQAKSGRGVLPVRDSLRCNMPGKMLLGQIWQLVA